VQEENVVDGQTSDRQTAAPAVLLRAGLVVAAGAAAVNLAVLWLAGAAFDLDGEFSSLEPRAVGVTTVVSLLAGTAVLGLLQRRSRRPVRTFRALAVAVTVLSLGGPLFVATADPPDGPRFAAGATAAVLAVMHVVAGAAAVGPLVALALPDDGRRR
jgi:peptidoglycan/LPS O-acetylase OafA/YrhL